MREGIIFWLCFSLAFQPWLARLGWGNGQYSCAQRILDPRGIQPIRYYYDEDGRLIKITDAKGGEIKLAHSISDSGGAETIYDQRGYPTTYFYDERGTVTAVKNALGDMTLYQYDDQPRGIAGHANYYRGNPDKPTAITEALGNTTYYEYDWAGRTTKITDPEGNVTENQYDSTGNLTLSVQSTADPENAGQLIELSRTQNLYDSRGRLIESIDALGHSTTYVYDGNNNNLLETHRYSTDPLSGQVVDVQTTYTYGDGNVPGSPDSITGPDGLTRYFGYDEKGNQYKSWYHWADANDPNNYGTVTNLTKHDS
ncbi:MAG: hypothetical protein ACYTEX_26655, partial [Planctomycetota bacterium]